MYKVSKMVIEYAKENKCSEIVIGDIKNIKQGMDNNTSFVQIPIQSLVNKIEYKAKLEGIRISADINVNLNILGKYMKKSKPNLEIVMDNGREQRPLKKSVA